MSNGATSVASFMAHKDKIDILSPTWYQIDQNGFVSGEPQPGIVKAAKDAHITLIPLFALFNPDKAHALFNDPKAQDAMIASMIRECKENGYDGVNLDIEDVMWTDRDGLSALVKKVSDALHQQHLQVQIDVVPDAPGHPGDSAFSTWMFQEWRGGYDLKALAESVDLICLMTYDQNTRWTEPGPVDGWIWTNQNLDYALKFVPKNKISLGIALYGYHWYTGEPGFDGKDRIPHPTADYISYANTIYLRDTYGGKTQWDEEDHTPGSSSTATRCANGFSTPTSAPSWIASTSPRSRPARRLRLGSRRRRSRHLGCDSFQALSGTCTKQKPSHTRGLFFAKFAKRYSTSRPERSCPYDRPPRRTH
jgi:spore germination protein YaaH